LPSNENPEQKFKTFFEKDHRRKCETDGEFKTNEIIQSVFEDIYIKHKDNCFTKDFKNVQDHPLYNKILSFKSEIKADDGEQKKLTCDEIMQHYLSESLSKCNKEYYKFSLKFISLFRECLNKLKVDEVELVNGKRLTFCEVCPAEHAPDFCNEFITDFMEGADFFGWASDRERLELIEIIQHFCHWLYNNSYTTSRLTLLSG
jgi:hypothetical protein